MGMWGVIAGCAWGLAAYWAVAVSPAAALRQELEARWTPPRPWRARLLAALARRGGLLAALRHELAATDTDPRAFALRTAGFAAAGTLLMGLDGGPAFAPVGALLGAGVARLWLARRYRGWLAEVVGALGDLVLLLKARLQAGDTVEQAVEAVTPHLTGALRVEWERLVARRQSGLPLREALWAFADRVYDRDAAAVIAQLAHYDREAVPAEPFGTLAGHLTRIQLLRRDYLVRRATSTITVYAGLALFAAMVSALGPALYVLWVQSISGVPL
ncbi:MAG: type II secretion system F family protein [Actinomycetia bacterium]|nr:type II secretion system F family protein [Actinomycetes bacterium]